MRIQQLTYRETWIMSYAMLFGAMTGTTITYIGFKEYLSAFLAPLCILFVFCIGLIILKIIEKIFKIKEPNEEKKDTTKELDITLKKYKEYLDKIGR